MLGHVSGHNKWRESCGQVIWIISSICYLQLSINAALNSPCVSSLPASCQLLFSPPCWPPGRERGWGMRRAQSLWDVKHPSHLPPAFMPPRQELQRERERGDGEQKREKREKWKQTEYKVIRERRTNQMTWFLGEGFDLLANWLSGEFLTGGSQK